MEATTINKRKLIDIKLPVFESLSKAAQRERVSLKHYIETLLEDEARRLREPVRSSYTKSVAQLIGSALPKKGQVSDIQDDRLQYLLSK